MEHNGLTDDAVETLALALLACPSCQHLVLRGNQCSHAGALALAKLLAWQQGGEAAESALVTALGVSLPVRALDVLVRGDDTLINHSWIRHCLQTSPKRAAGSFHTTKRRPQVREHTGFQGGLT